MSKTQQPKQSPHPRVPPTHRDVKNWLMNHGAPLEMRIARQLDELGFLVGQSLYWKDAESEKALEIDIQAQFTLVQKPCLSVADAFNPRGIEVEYLIECKVITDYPWIVFRKDDEPEPNDWTHRRGLIMSEKAYGYMDRIFDAPMEPKDLHFVRAFGIHGYGVAVYDGRNQPKGQSDPNGDLAFSTLKKISKAARYFAHSDQGIFKPIARLVVPVIVVSGNLYAASLGSSNRVSVKPIHKAHIYWNGNTNRATNGRVQILTESAVRDYFTNQMNDLKRLNSFLEPHAQAVCSDPSLVPILGMGPTFWEQAVDAESALSQRLKIEGTPQKPGNAF